MSATFDRTTSQNLPATDIREESPVTKAISAEPGPAESDEWGAGAMSVEDVIRLEAALRAQSGDSAFCLPRVPSTPEALNMLDPGVTGEDSGFD